MPNRASIVAVLAVLLLIGRTAGAEAQLASPPLPTWSSTPVEPAYPSRLWEGNESRTHTTTGLLVGAAVGAAATTIFLIGFCSGSDTVCGIDEVGRATLFIAVPAAGLGALIGSLIRTDE